MQRRASAVQLLQSWHVKAQKQTLYPRGSEPAFLKRRATNIS